VTPPALRECEGPEANEEAAVSNEVDAQLTKLLE